MSFFHSIHHVQTNIARHTKRHKKFEETEQPPDMARMLKLSEWKFKTAIINILSNLMDKVDKQHARIL